MVDRCSVLSPSDRVTYFGELERVHGVGFWQRNRTPGYHRDAVVFGNDVAASVCIFIDFRNGEYVDTDNHFKDKTEKSRARGKCRFGRNGNGGGKS